MNCFVIAMDKEAKPVTDRMTHVKEKQISGKRVIFGTLFKKKDRRCYLRRGQGKRRLRRAACNRFA